MKNKQKLTEELTEELTEDFKISAFLLWCSVALSSVSQTLVYCNAIDLKTGLIIYMTSVIVGSVSLILNFYFKL